MHKIGEIDVVSIGLIEFHLSGNWLFATRPDKKIALEDSAIKVRVDPKSGVKSYYIDGDLFGFEEGRTIPVPSSILKTRDQMRENRAAEHSRLMLRKIGEALYPQGVIEFFIFVDIFVIGIEDRTTTISDDKIDDGYRVNGKDVSGFKGQSLTIPLEIIEARDRVRKINEANKKLKPVGKIAGPESPIVFFLKDTGELVVRYGEKEVVASQIENVYGKPAVLISELNLGHPYLEVPVEVHNAFKKLRKELALADLHLVSVGTSLLDGREYWKLSTKIPKDAFKTVEYLFQDYGYVPGCAFSNWLTSEPEKVATALGLKHNIEPDNAINKTL